MEREIKMAEKGLVPKEGSALDLVGQIANKAAARNVFADYQSRKSLNTLKRQRSGLALFAEYLAQAGVHVEPEALISEPMAWRGITWGLVEGFVKWQLQRGYAVSSINVRLATVKTYAGMATKAGAITPQDYAMIRLVRGYSNGEARHINEKRRDAGIATRYKREQGGEKKETPNVLTKKQARVLKDQPNTPQGRRDRVMIGLMLDLGLRVGEVSLLDVSNFNLEAGEVTFYRPKVDKTQTHSLDVNGLLEAVRAYIELDALPVGPLLRASRKDGSLQESGMSERAITARVKALGEAIGIDNLSAHDLRHTWCTKAARAGTPLDRLMDAGGWSSPYMPLRYIMAARVSNEGIKLE